MNYKRPEDQYKKAEAPEMIKELNKIIEVTRCGLSMVKTYKHLKFEEFEHVGTLVHTCNLPMDHKDVQSKDHNLKCKCACGVEFYGWR